MGNVSLDAGINVLNVYGQSAAGLTIDSEEASRSGQASPLKKLDSTQEDDTSKAQATVALQKISESHEDQKLNPVTTSTVEAEALAEAVEESDIKVGNASAFTTNSEITYKKNNFTHQSRPNNDGSVTLTRDLYVEQLRIENLGGDHYDQNRTVGDIILSDWRSRGDTTVTPR